MSSQTLSQMAGMGLLCLTLLACSKFNSLPAAYPISQKKKKQCNDNTSFTRRSCQASIEQEVANIFPQSFEPFAKSRQQNSSHVCTQNDFAMACDLDPERKGYEISGRFSAELPWIKIRILILVGGTGLKYLGQTSLVTTRGRYKS